MKALAALIILVTTPAFAATVNCLVDVYGKDSQQIAKLHKEISFAQAGAGETFEYSEVIKVLPTLKVACGRTIDAKSVNCSFVNAGGKSLSEGGADNLVSGVTLKIVDQQASLAAGFSNTIVVCKAQ